jgi:proton-translocating NADH-quinone oxidoreductase chain N
MLYGMSLLYGATGTTNLRGIAEALATGGNLATFRWVVFPAIVMLLAGFGFKISLVPFHQWAPDVYEGAPTPITAFLSVGPKAAGFAVLLRTMLVALPDLQVDWIAVLAGISMVTMTLGNLVAISQRNIKRMLAYSSIAQAGYILIGLVSVNPDLSQTINGVNGTLLYLLAYLFSNLGAFLAVIAFYHLAGSDQIRDYAGLARRSPWIAGCLVVFFMSLVGLPPTAGFVGKLTVFSAAIQQGESRFYALAIVGVLNSVLSLYYYFNVVRHMFFLPAEEQTRKPIPAPLFAALIIALVMTLGIGLFPQPFFEFASRSAQMLLPV